MARALKPYVFKTREELIECLQSTKTKKLAEDFFNRRIPTISEIVRISVSGNTFRAFRNLPQPPSKVFRVWSEKYIESTIEKLKLIDKPEAFFEYVDTASKELCNHWQNTMKDILGYGRASKLLNLLFKEVACYKDISDEFRKKLINFLHVPLDSYTIIGLKDIEPCKKIPKNATMGFVENRDQYIALQNIIADIAKEARVSPIYYEILAWNIAH